MRRIKQISFDVIVNENVDGYDLAEEIADFLSKNGYDVLGSSFQEDMTDLYKDVYGYIL